MTLKVSDLCVARSGVLVLQDVTFTLEPGKALVLRGPNGVGKTTLLRTIAGLQPPVAGRIEGAEERVAYAAHADGVKSALTVTENLGFWASVFGDLSIHAALSAFDLAELAARRAGTLSAGQKRQLALARLLVTGRPIWILDEPTVSLDQEAVEMFSAAVQAHQRHGGMALLATHIDLGLEADVLDVRRFRADAASRQGASDEAFL
ncbi:MAG: heme ABC exporter ATP-binding protein CcmA [Pseudomonadota bacterium]